MKQFKRYLFEFALFFLLWMAFSALMEIAYKDDFTLLMKYGFCTLIIIVVEAVGSRLFNKR